MSDESPKALLELALEMAREAVALSHGWQRAKDVSFKRDGSVVTALDRAIQELIVSRIAERYPGHGVCAEEKLSKPEAHAPLKSARFVWVIDPLDGTRNFALGFPCFATAIGVLDRGVPVAAVVHEHNLDAAYYATRGGGAFRDGQRISVFDPGDKDEFLLGVPSTKDAQTVTLIRHWAGISRIITRNVGVSNVHLALVAYGGLAAAYNKRAKIWDIVPGALLVTEAGGRITDPFGKELVPFDVTADPDRDVPFLCGAPRAYEWILASIRENVRQS
ncbi:MAG: hypothetical protein HY287_09510 [Planctomycetes bacterium]|nr:hypothetical protein [Planctomycetota bacterium]MBI3834549.1 hypothetical protein [Planctomycetota bacterium]